jgi:hypothetical protein
MVQPIDLQVLLNRTLELQRTQAVTLRQPQEENEIFKNRTNQEIAEEERQVRRKKEKVHGRVEEEKNRFRGRDARGDEEKEHQKKQERYAAAKKDGLEKEKGRLIDMEV